MFIGQLLARFRPPTSEQSENKVAAIAQRESSNEARSKHFLPETADNPSPKKNFKKVLNGIDQAIRSGGKNNELLLQKAEILLHKSKFHQARQILNSLSKNKDDSATAKAAKQLLKSLELLQREAATNKLIDGLQKTANKYNNRLRDITVAKNLTPDLDVTQIVRKEAQRARTSMLPKLSYELIDQTLQAGHESPWLLHDKALSLNMMGQQAKALELLNDLKKSNKGDKITNSINKSIEDIRKKTRRHQSRIKIYLAIQVKATAKSNNLKTKFMPEIHNINDKTNIKSLAFKEAQATLIKNPQASLDIIDSILDYFPGDLAALQLKGETLAALNHNEEAIEIWKNLARSHNEKIAQKACELMAIILTKNAKIISDNGSPKEAISFFIKQYLKHNLAPTLNQEIKEILVQIEPPNSDISDPELQRHQLQLQFNTLVIEHLETQLHEKGRLDASAAAQRPGAIRKTAREAG